MAHNASTPHLIIATSHGREDVPLQQNQLTLGRDPTSDIVIADQVVAFVHALLERTRGGYEIIDAGGASGLTFNGARVQRRTLADGDVIWIGPNISLTDEGATAHVGQIAREGELRLDAIHLKQFIDKKHNLLQDISLSVLPRVVVVAG